MRRAEKKLQFRMGRWGVRGPNGDGGGSSGGVQDTAGAGATGTARDAAAARSGGGGCGGGGGGPSQLEGMVQSLVFALKFLPFDAVPVAVVVSDGVGDYGGLLDYDSLIMQLCRHDIVVHCVLLEHSEDGGGGGGGRTSNVAAAHPFGFLPDWNGLAHLSAVTGGRLFDLDTLAAAAGVADSGSAGGMTATLPPLQLPPSSTPPAPRGLRPTKLQQLVLFRQSPLNPFSLEPLRRFWSSGAAVLEMPSRDLSRGLGPVTTAHGATPQHRPHQVAAAPGTDAVLPLAGSAATVATRSGAEVGAFREQVHAYSLRGVQLGRLVAMRCSEGFRVVELRVGGGGHTGSGIGDGLGMPAAAAIRQSGLSSSMRGMRAHGCGGSAGFGGRGGGGSGNGAVFAGCGHNSGVGLNMSAGAGGGRVSGRGAMVAVLVRFSLAWRHDVRVDYNMDFGVAPGTALATGQLADAACSAGGSATVKVEVAAGMDFLRRFQAVLQRGGSSGGGVCGGPSAGVAGLGARVGGLFFQLAPAVPSGGGRPWGVAGAGSGAPPHQSWEVAPNRLRLFLRALEEVDRGAAYIYRMGPGSAQLPAATAAPTLGVRRLQSQGGTMESRIVVGLAESSGGNATVAAAAAVAAATAAASRYDWMKDLRTSQWHRWFDVEYLEVIFRGDLAPLAEDAASAQVPGSEPDDGASTGSSAAGALANSASTAATSAASVAALPLVTEPAGPARQGAVGMRELGIVFEGAELEVADRNIDGYAPAPSSGDAPSAAAAAAAGTAATAVTGVKERCCERGSGASAFWKGSRTSGAALASRDIGNKQLLSDALAGWSSHVLTPALYLKIVAPHEVQPVADAPAIAAKLTNGGNSGAVAALAPAATMGGSAFCLLRVAWETPNLAVLHMGFFGVEAPTRAQIIAALTVHIWGSRDPATGAPAAAPFALSGSAGSVAAAAAAGLPSPTLQGLLHKINTGLSGLETTIAFQLAKGGATEQGRTNVGFERGGSRPVPSSLGGATAAQSTAAPTAAAATGGERAITLPVDFFRNVPFGKYVSTYLRRRRWVWELSCDVAWSPLVIRTLALARQNDGFVDIELGESRALMVKGVKVLPVRGGDGGGGGGGSGDSTGCGVGRSGGREPSGNDAPTAFDPQRMLLQYRAFAMGPRQLVTELLMEPQYGFVPDAPPDGGGWLSDSQLFDGLLAYVPRADLCVMAAFNTFAAVHELCAGSAQTAAPKSELPGWNSFEPATSASPDGCTAHQRHPQQPPLPPQPAPLSRDHLQQQRRHLPQPLQHQEQHHQQRRWRSVPDAQEAAWWLAAVEEDDGDETTSRVTVPLSLMHLLSHAEQRELALQMFHLADGAPAWLAQIGASDPGKDPAAAAAAMAAAAEDDCRCPAPARPPGVSPKPAPAEEDLVVEFGGGSLAAGEVRRRMGSGAAGGAFHRFTGSGSNSHNLKPDHRKGDVADVCLDSADDAPLRPGAAVGDMPPEAPQQLAAAAAGGRFPGMCATCHRCPRVSVEGTPPLVAGPEGARPNKQLYDMLERDLRALNDAEITWNVLPEQTPGLAPPEGGTGQDARGGGDHRGGAGGATANQQTAGAAAAAAMDESAAESRLRMRCQGCLFRANSASCLLGMSDAAGGSRGSSTTACSW
ncbi:unnamed protein product [Phaeothamnion confervicola]